MEPEKEDYYKQVRLGDFWNNNYIEYENNDDRNKVVSIEEYLNKIRLYLKDKIMKNDKADEVIEELFQ